MQFPAIAAILSLAAFGAAQSCTHGDYNCGFHNGTQPAIFICNNGAKHLTAICARDCEVINGLPYCK